MNRLILTATGALLAVAVAEAGDEFEISLVEHRVRDGHVLVNGALNVAFGPGLMDPEVPVSLPFHRSQPPIHAVNLTARFDRQLTVAIEPYDVGPVELFGITRRKPTLTDLRSPRMFGSVVIESGWSPERVFRRIEIQDVRVASRATPAPKRGTYSLKPRAVGLGQTRSLVQRRK